MFYGSGESVSIQFDFRSKDGASIFFFYAQSNKKANQFFCVALSENPS